MKKAQNNLRLSMIVLALSSALFLNSCQFDNNEEDVYVRTMPHVTTAMLHDDYWLTYNSKKLIMTKTEIEAANQRILDSSKKDEIIMTDILNYSKYITEETLYKKLNTTIQPDDTELFLDGQKITDNYLKKLRANFNLKNIKSQNTVKYALCIAYSNLRSAPTDDVLTDEDDPYQDHLQDTAIYENEPLLVVHQSTDEKWVFVQAKLHYGWIKANHIAYCKTRQEWLKAQQLGEFLLITGDKVFMQRQRTNPQQPARELSMGTCFSLVKATDAPEKIDERFFRDNYVIKMPERDKDGFLNYSYALIPFSADVHIGYLPYTQQHLLQQMFKSLGNIYGWGDMYNSRDCSSTTRAIYSCFGFYFPRNSSWQAQMPFKKIDLSSMTIAAKKKAIRSLPTGTLLFFNGHIAAYVGYEREYFYVISTTGSCCLGKDEPRLRIAGTALTEISTTFRSNGRSWLDEFKTAVLIVPDKKQR